MIILFIYIYYTTLDCLCNHLYFGRRTIIIGIVYQNLEFLMGPIYLDISKSY